MNKFKQSPQQNQGFIRIIVILVILLLVFTFAGFNLQGSLSLDSLLSHLINLWDKLTVFYDDQLQAPLQRFVIDPAIAIHATVNGYIITPLQDFLQEIISQPPKWS